MLKIEEDQPIEAKIISSAIEKSQTRVEGLHFDSRKHVLEYDDVISKQRNKIYTQRNEILHNKSLSNFVFNIVKQEIEKTDDLEEIKTILPITEKKNKQELFDLALNLLKEKDDKLLRFVCLKSIDMFWTEHLVNLEHLKDSVKLKAYGGKDPLVEYKTEGHRMFQGLWDSINSQIARTVFKVSLN